MVEKVEEDVKSNITYELEQDDREHVLEIWDKEGFTKEEWDKIQENKEKLITPEDWERYEEEQRIQDELDEIKAAEEINMEQ